MKASLLLLFAVTVFKAVFSQSSKESMEALSHLRFMEGTWKGVGWIQTGAKKQSFHETETVTSKLSGSSFLRRVSST